MKTALITGISGQDGRYLADLLIEHGYSVHGTTRGTGDARGRAVRVHTVQLGDGVSLRALLETVQPDEVYHFAAQSSVSASFRDPAGTYQSNIDGTHNVLAAILDVVPKARTYFAGSCEMFGMAGSNPAHERTVCRPVSPYGIAKLTGYHIARHYRDAHRMHVTCGIAFNHDSPLRGQAFVTAKIARAAARISAGLEDCMLIGNLDVRRDWGFAPEYVDAIWRLTAQHDAGDFVLATGRCTSLERLLDAAFDEAGLDWERHAKHDAQLLRPVDIPELYGDPLKVRDAIGWQAETSGEAVMRMMVRAEMARLEDSEP